MSQINKLIFGLNIKILCSEDNYFKVLSEELTLYKDSNEDTDYTVEIITHKKFDYSLNNPSDHFLTKNGFAMQSGSNIIEWDFKNNKVYIYITPFISNFKSAKRRFFNIQFLYPHQEIGQYLHENILVPLMFFIKGNAPIHCSAISVNGNVRLLGGTGGVGKTSTLLALSKEKNVEFVTDDILIVSDLDGFYPNYAYPKIYAYNTIGDEGLERQLIGNGGLNSFQWKFKKKRNIAGVRRRISPSELYHISDSTKKLKTYYLFSRGDYQDISIEDISLDKLTKITSLIIQNEYSEFFTHLIWYEMNCDISDLKPVYTKAQIINEMESVYKNSILPKMKLKMIKVPRSIDHSIFKDFMLNLLRRD